jgi:hypothetical protein
VGRERQRHAALVDEEQERENHHRDAAVQTL